LRHDSFIDKKIYIDVI